MGKPWKLSRMNQAGFTLVEILVALTILGIISMTFATIINGGALQSFYNNQENTAIALAQEKMEQIKSVMPGQATDFAKVIANFPLTTPDTFTYATDSSTPPSSGIGTETLTRNGTTFTRVWNWQTLKSGTTTGPTAQYLFQVNVTVSWTYKTKYSSSPHSITQTSFVTGR